MSNKWWNGPQTTTGRGIYSQYNPDSIKEWVERSQSPRRVGTSDRSLAQLRELQRPTTTSTGHRTMEPRPVNAHVQQPLSSPMLPQFVHHHHFGWLPPSPERRVGGSIAHASPRQAGHGVSYGIANSHNHQIHNTHMLISGRKP
ncbi:hypothetical protein CHLRE_03g170050v5 [Chlamydomonas reinhardtii]|uniref:Uncharacterized protein n=1 Tax=Chlamydomonas reinhardtii TaxID=3055 RepID=A8IES9_CHLRE|nr:uncharacterized protein CHLRE_03g170050v5 [Chlamydomonas reinhardtii]PNW85060.1 hypothetical protein CHLRE_03g170050v5 [Chlamydomonas reinhardtii]|eukprot:XP_001703323.1 predicted protein [Chlamydomonas reinhardtii]